MSGDDGYSQNENAPRHRNNLKLLVVLRILKDEEMIMNWVNDPNVCFWANATMPRLPTVQLQQAPGGGVNLHNWQIGGWLNLPLPTGLPAQTVSSPNNIIWCFQNGHWLEGVALVASWGIMKRAKRMIMGAAQIQPQHRSAVSNAMQNAWNDISNSATLQANWSIQNAWTRLTGGGVNGLNWTPVITSKTLHFMTRAMGVLNDVPVPLDNKITRKCLWPLFIGRVNHLRTAYPNSPYFINNLNGRNFAVYNSYMTAIRVWAARQSVNTGANWSTTDVESTLFSMLRTNCHLVWI
jgi:hypothetical protein